MRVLFCSFLIVGAVGCASSTPYRPADKNGLGYQDQKLEDKKFRVSFKGNSSTPKETAEIYLLYRSAEIAKEQGAPYFVVVQQSTDTQPQASSSAVYGGFGSRAVSGFGLGLGVGSGGPTTNRYESVAYITLHESPPPEPARSYSTEEVLKNLEPKIERKK